MKDTSYNDHPIFSPAGLVTSNVWQHVAATYVQSSGIATIYLNGAVVAQQTLGTFTPQTFGDLYIGVRPDAGFRFAGLMDEVSLYNRGLSAAEIQAIYNAGSLGKCATAPQFVLQPQSQTVKALTSAALTASAAGSQPMTYQWLFNGAPLPGATNSKLAFASVQATNAGTYALAATNGLNFAISSNAVLKVQLVSVYANGQLLTNSQYTLAPPRSSP